MDAAEVLIGFLLFAGLVWALYNHTHRKSNARK